MSSTELRVAVAASEEQKAIPQSDADPLPAGATDESNGTVTYRFDGDKNIQEKAARFLADIKARLYGP